MSLPKPYYAHDNIRIYLGDCQAIVSELTDASVDMIFTDPSYGHHYNNGDLIHRREVALGHGMVGNAPTRPLLNDGIEANVLVQWLFRQAARVLKPAGSCCCCGGGGGPDPQFARWSLWMDEHLTFKQMVVWDKGSMGMGWHYRRSYETVLVGHRGDKCRWYDTTNKVENIIRHIPKIIPSATQHPTVKPVALAAYFLRLHTQAGDLVLDPFMGSGGTAVACKELRRYFIGCELDERLCEVAAKRLSQEVFDFA